MFLYSDIIKKSAIFALLVMGLLGSVLEATSGFGIHSWAGWKPGQISREDCPELRGVPIILKWNSLEPKPGKYRFEEEFGPTNRVYRSARDINHCLSVKQSSW